MTNHEPETERSVARSERSSAPGSVGPVGAPVDVIGLQRTAGNAAVAALLRATPPAVERCACGGPIGAGGLCPTCREATKISPSTLARFGSSGLRVLARYVPAAVYAPPPVYTPPAPLPRPAGPAGTGASGVSPAFGGPARPQSYARAPENSYAGIQQRIKTMDTIAEAIREGERPIATLEPGGKPPDFIFVRGTRREVLAIEDEPWPTIEFRERAFSVLDALDYDVSQVNDENELKLVYLSYFPDSQWSGLATSSAPPGSPRTILDRYSFSESIVYEPKRFDPGGTARFSVLLSAARKRAKTAPALGASQLLKEILAMDLDVPADRTPVAGPCQVRDVPRAGGTATHNQYANRVTGSMTDFWIKTPEGIEVQTDGRDALDPERVWEVKTAHEWATDFGQTSLSLFSPYISGRVFKMEEQRARFVGVCRRCGYKPAYAFDNEDVARYVRRMWGNDPPVHYVP